MCIYALREFVEHYKARSTTVFVTFLDAIKAFDRLDYWLLFDKMLSRNTPAFIVRILAFWYSTQSLTVRWGNTYSNNFLVSNGVKQGGILSPRLFNIHVYMNDMSVLLNDSNIGGKIGGILVNHLSYADDICLISLSSRGMSQLLEICSNFAITHSLTYNTKKSMCMCFTPKSINFVKPSFMLNNNVIPYVENCKYLGIVIHLQSDMYDIKRQIRKFYANTNMLLRKFSICSYQVKCHLFRSYCANMYCPYFWFNKSKTCLKKLQICYNNSLRRLLRIPKRSSASEMFVNLNIPAFGELLRKCVFGFCFRLDNCNINNIIGSITRSSVVYNSKCWQWWYKVLH